MCTAKQLSQLIADELDDLLSGRYAVEHLVAKTLFLHFFDEVACHLEVDVGLKQCHSHLAKGVFDVLFRQFAVAAQVPERLLEGR